MEDILKCKKCSKSLIGKEYRKVADWVFCMDCFEALLKEKDQTESHPKEQPAQEKDAPEVKRCHICKKELKDGEAKKLGIWFFCPQCHDNMVLRPTPGTTEIKADVETDTTLSISLVEQVEIDRTSTVNCHGCGKQILKIAGKVFEENIYCPDCYYALPDIKEG